MDAATRRIKDPSERLTSEVNSKDIQDAQEFIRNHVVGVDATVPAFTLSCLQTNVFGEHFPRRSWELFDSLLTQAPLDNMFVLDYLPKQYLRGGAEKSIVVFTAGWAMKFVPLLGKALAEMALHGESQYALDQFSVTRKNPKTGEGIIVESVNQASVAASAFAFQGQASGSSLRGYHNTGL